MVNKGNLFNAWLPLKIRTNYVRVRNIVRFWDKLAVIASRKYLMRRGMI